MTSVICSIDPQTRIAVKDRSFVLQSCKNSVWSDVARYSWIGDAIKGYVLFALQNYGNVSGWGGVQELSTQIEGLNTSIKSVDKKLCKFWRVVENDPIEEEFLGGKDV